MSSMSLFICVVERVTINLCFLVLVQVSLLLTNLLFYEFYLINSSLLLLILVLLLTADGGIF